MADLSAHPSNSETLRAPSWRGDLPKTGDYIYSSKGLPNYRVVSVEGDRKTGLTIRCEMTREFAPWADAPKGTVVCHWEWRIGMLPKVPADV